MDKLRKARTCIRNTFSRTCTQLRAELAADDPDKSNLKKNLAKLQDKNNDLALVDQKILDLLLEQCTDEEAAEEYQHIEYYQDKFRDVKFDVMAFIGVVNGTEVSTDNGSCTSSKRNFKLPELELKKFGGDVKDWLSFWSQFSKIDEDDGIDAADKFQYLLQATVTGSRARELKESYPPTAANYPEVVTSLRSRFGREELLVEVYVRELLRLVLSNATTPKSKMILTTLYDKLESQLRALGTIGVTRDIYAAMLYPLVESALPEDILRTWQRSMTSTSALCDGNTDRLTLLMLFLEAEVEGEERITLARSGFGLSSEKTTKTIAKCDAVPTATGLFSGEGVSTAQKKVVNCAFCEKDHLTEKCFKAKKMSLQEKKICLQQKRCFICFKVGHSAKKCWSKVQCPICERKHLATMCPELQTRIEAQTTSTVSQKENTSNQVLASFSGLQEVLLQTVMVKIRTDSGVRVVPAIIDSGSQRSYVLQKIACDLNCHSIGEEMIIHSLFGGIESSQQAHRMYEVSVSSLQDDYSCIVKVLEHLCICKSIPRIKYGPWVDELEKRKIKLTDVGVDNAEIGMLIGADIAGKLLTGRIIELRSGPVAVETRLGWTLMGKLRNKDSRNNTALIVTSMYVKAATILDLWRLDTIGINDPTEIKLKEEMHEEARQHFLRTVKINEEGRYEVSLPWIEGHPVLQSNRCMAEKRLGSMTRKLIDEGRKRDYQDVFEEWLIEGVIEKDPEGEEVQFGHYLPHRPVIKEGSTTKVRPVFDASAHEKNYPSLNDCLEKGPNLIELIPVVLTRFREHKIGVIADIKKAFLQLSVNKSDRDNLQFLWWDNYEEQKMQMYRHRRVVLV